FAQHQLEALHLENEILRELQAFAPKHTETELRSILGCFLFTGDDAFKKIKVLSGGEKSRVALAKALTADANFLILDEPTNHLDIQSVNILIQALQQFEGTMIVVSHDRYFLDNVANKIWFIENQKIKEYPGTYAEYEEWLSKRTVEETKPAPAPKKEEKAARPKAQPSAAADKTKELKKLNQSLKQLEEEIADLEKQVSEAEADLGKEDVYSNPDKLAEANRKYQSVSPRLIKAQAEWERLAEQIMELEAS
ncbi:MAG TPA: ATP-binding cassette domain-containing protein, partial [Sphingobacteriaceae bacterium]